MTRTWRGTARTQLPASWLVRGWTSRRRPPRGGDSAPRGCSSACRRGGSPCWRGGSACWRGGSASWGGSSASRGGSSARSTPLWCSSTRGAPFRSAGARWSFGDFARCWCLRSRWCWHGNRVGLSLVCLVRHRCGGATSQNLGFGFHGCEHILWREVVWEVAGYTWRAAAATAGATAGTAADVAPWRDT